ncbi:hypothetical protein J1G42_06100 [Cellulomonas sp. zg-ZUI222]|uniref:Lipoprotein n=1 Tax=Cellulomonas wangleii TaxID=2816956 RepID=A0ABX8D279_9CELL|nr:hypothetical protein [Cellulomonas wangleii]MBO0920395.1 hypothetical protein [Cellulomonas wangleii]MBO0923187.1 hypothetical protein [Cellulomonas wangleii]QVI61560.1 hypothetical protein KG103_13940 [Cellulomonas wangleii]
MSGRLRTIALAVVLSLAGTTGGCAPGRDREGEARDAALDRVRYLRSLLGELLEDAGPLPDEEFEAFVTTEVGDRFEGSLDPTGFHDGRATWRGAALGSVAGPLKSQVAAAACFDVEIERGTATVTFDDAPCSEQVRRTLGVTGNEDNVVGVDLLPTVDDPTP